MCVCVLERDSVCVCVCVCVLERDSVCVCVCVREIVCVCARGRENSGGIVSILKLNCAQ